MPSTLNYATRFAATLQKLILRRIYFTADPLIQAVDKVIRQRIAINDCWPRDRAMGRVDKHSMLTCIFVHLWIHLVPSPPLRTGLMP